MNFPASRNRFAPTGYDRPAVFVKSLWLAATANHEAMSDPESSVSVAVSTDAAAIELGSMVIDYARTAFRVQVRRQDEKLVWPNGATLEFSVTGRAKIRGDRPSFIAQDEIRSLT